MFDANDSALCQIDRALPVSVPGDGDDIGNLWDTMATTLAILEHNARLRAACPAD